MFGLTKREQQQAAWEREAALVIPAMVEIAKAALQADTPPRAARDCRTCRKTITQYGVVRCNARGNAPDSARTE